MKIQTRLGKMHYKTVPNKQGLWPNFIRTPWLNLSGHWLEKAGFPVGEPIVITVLKNKLIISKIKTETNDSAKKERYEQHDKNQNVRRKMHEAESVS